MPTAKSSGSSLRGEKLFLKFDREKQPAQYVFSPDNTETPLWLEAEAEGEDAQITVRMTDQNGEVVTTPDEYGRFALKAEDRPRFNSQRGSNRWQIGKFRVDATLLARQRARWFGRDLFIEQHGGEEYAEDAGKERIDFTEQEPPYSIYLGVGDTAAWKEGKWEMMSPGPESRPYPLLQVKKVEDRLMGFELWDPSGQTKVTINLLKSREPWIPQRLLKDFKFIASRTRTQYVFEVKGVRTILKPQDWLLLTDNKWVKLATVDEIDAYVDRNVTGPLFIFDGVAKGEEGQQVLRGQLYNSSRTAVEVVEIPTQSANVTLISVPKTEDEGEEDGDDDEEEDLPPPRPIMERRPPRQTPRRL